MTSTRDSRRALSPIATEPTAATLQVGASAPMFSYMAADGRWHRFDEHLVDGDALVMFASSEDELLGVQRMRSAFRSIGATPVAILDVPTRGASAMARKLSLDVPIVSDPMCAIAGLYHSLDPSSGRPMPSYFVIDASHRLRAMYFGPLPPPEILLATTARCLGRALPPDVFSGDTH